MNLNALSAAISNTGIALLDSSSTYDRLIINVGEQQQLVVSTLEKTVKEGELVPAQTIVLEGIDLSNEHNQRFFALALHGIQFTKQTPYATEEQHNKFMAWRLVNITLPRLMGTIDETEATARATKSLESFDFEAYGVNKEWFATGNVSTLKLDGGYKAYLLPQHLDKLPLIMPHIDLTYGFAQVSSGNYTGCFAVKLVKGATA